MFFTLNGFFVSAQISKYNYFLKGAIANSAAKQYIKAITILDSAKLLKGIDKSYSDSIDFLYAQDYYKIKIMDSAVFYYGEALKYFEKTNNYVAQGNVYNALGIIELKISSDFNKSIIDFEKAKMFYANANDSSKILESISNIGMVYLSQGKYNSALHIFKNLFAVNKNSNETIKNNALFSIGDTYFYLKKYDSAIFYYNKTINVFTTQGDFNNLISVYINKGYCLLEQKKINESLNCFIASMHLITPETQATVKKELYQNLADNYNNLGNYKKAFYYKNLESYIVDTINSEGVTNALNEMEAKYNIGKKQDSLLIESQSLQLEKNKSRQRQKNFFIVLSILGVVGLITILAFRNVHIRKKANHILTVQKQEVQQLANQLNIANQTKATLFSTIGHDLRSPISTLYALLKMQEIKGETVDTTAMSNQTIHLLDTLEDLLIWSKTQMEQFVQMPVWVHINLLYEELIGFYASTATSKNLKIINGAVDGITLRCDENILRTILRNAIGNAINNTKSGESVLLQAEKKSATTLCCSIKNKCQPDDFDQFKIAFDNAGVQSGSHGLGLILIKEFAAKMNAIVKLDFIDGWAAMHILLPIES